MFYLPTVNVGEIPDAPRQDEARAAYKYVADVYQDFPFSGCNVSGPFNHVPIDDGNLAAAIAYPLTMVGRAAIEGQVPGFAFTANCTRTGKSRAAKLGIWIAVGEKPAFTSFLRGEPAFTSCSPVTCSACPCRC